MDAYVSKPVDPDTLYERIWALMKSPTQRAASQRDAGARPAGSAATKALPIDVDALLHRCRGKAQLVESLLGKFEAAVSVQVQQLREGVERSDADAVSRLAHTIKGASANLSADAVSVTAAELERLSTAGNWESTVECLRQLEEQVRECLDFLPAATSSAKQLAQVVRA
jgi:HPt (histidine-containing phosphotransfer) domain-containing protein